MYHGNGLAMFRLATLVLTLSMTMGAAAPLLCELGCFSHALPSHQACHEDPSGLRLSAGGESCVHAVPDVTAIVAVKAIVTPELTYAILSGTTESYTAFALQVEHATRAAGATVHSRSVSRSILRI